jgi:drug/metabolite transporter (DMT)-like permease
VTLGVKLELSPTVRGALWMMGSTASWASMAAITRHFTGEIHVFEIVFFRSIFGMIFILPWLFEVGLGGLRTQRIGMHMARGFIGLGVIYILFTAITLSPMGEVAAIISTRPVIASLAAVIILHEVASGRRWTATLLGFTGALLIVRPGFSEVSTGTILALISVIFMAALTIIIKSLARTEAPDTIVVWQMVVFAPCSLIPALFVWQTPDLWQFTLLASTGLFGTLTQRCLTRSYAAADATAVLPFDFTRLIFAAAFGYILFEEFPDIWTWAGGTLIFAAVLWMTRGEAKSDTSKKAPVKVKHR